MHEKQVRRKDRKLNEGKDKARNEIDSSTSTSLNSREIQNKCHIPPSSTMLKPTTRHMIINRQKINRNMLKYLLFSISVQK
jgi:hypothetical protein